MRWIEERKDGRHGYGIEVDGMRDGFVRKGDNEDVRAGEIDKRARYDRVRDTRRRTRGDCNFSNCSIPSQTPRVVGRDFKWDGEALGGRGCLAGAGCRDERGQATVEFAVVTAAFLAATVALGVIWHAIGDGLLVDHAAAVASHHVQSVAPATIVDIFLY